MPDFEFREEIRESSREVLETGEKVSNAEKSLEVAQKTGIEEQIKAAEKGVAEARQEHIESSNKFAESLAKDSTGKVDPQRATELKELFKEVSGAKTAAEFTQIASKLPPDLQKVITDIGQKVSEVKLSGENIKEIKDANTKMTAAAADLQKATTPAEIEAAQEKVAKAASAMDQVLEKSGLKNPEIAKNGTRGWEILKTLYKFKGMIAIFGTLVGTLIYFKLVADSLTGCYQYTGSISKKILCDKSVLNEDIQGTCGCTSVLDERIATCTTDDEKKMVYCLSGCNSGVKLPTCTTSQGTPISILYTFKIFTIADAAAAVIQNIVNNVGAATDAALLQTLKTVGIVAGGIVALVIVLAILKYIWSHFVTGSAEVKQPVEAH